MWYICDMDPTLHNLKLILEGRERRQTAARMRAEGMTYAKIGQMLGVSRARAHRLVERAKELKETA